MRLDYQTCSLDDPAEPLLKRMLASGDSAMVVKNHAGKLAGVVDRASLLGASTALAPEPPQERVFRGNV